MSIKKGQTGADFADMGKIAELANVSRSTVSRALNDSPLVNEKTKQLIRELARQYNYVPNEAARNFRLRKTNIISVVPGLDTRSEQQPSDPFFLEMIGYLADELAALDFDLLLNHAPISNADEFMLSRVRRQSEGVIFLGQGQFNEELNKLADAGLPIIVWGGLVPVRRYPLVGSDNVAGGYLSARHLIEQGCRRIAFFGDVIQPEMALRHRGYQQALSDWTLPFVPKLSLSVSVEAGHAREEINGFLDAQPDFDGIVCCSDLIAMSAISCLAARGLRVPDDIAVCGYDNLSISPRTSPPLTTIDQKIRLAAGRLVSGLMDRIAGREVADAVEPSVLVVRGSTVRGTSSPG